MLHVFIQGCISINTYLLQQEIKQHQPKQPEFQNQEPAA